MASDLILVVALLGAGWYFLFGPGKGAIGGGGGGGAFSKGGSCPVGGQSCKFDGKDRWECENVAGSNYEATWCGTVNGKDDLTFKLWGPKHNGSACCWCLMWVNQKTGKFTIGGEGPHPNNSGVKATGGSMGSLSKPSCVKAVITKGAKGAHLEGYSLEGGKWKKQITYDGPCGNTKTSTTPASGQQVSFRFDVSGVKTTCATVKPLGGGSSKANYTSQFHYVQQQSKSYLVSPARVKGYIN